MLVFFFASGDGKLLLCIHFAMRNKVSFHSLPRKDQQPEHVARNLAMRRDFVVNDKPFQNLPFFSASYAFRTAKKSLKFCFLLP